MENVLFHKYDNGVAEITLNQPRSINSLTYDMLVKLKESLLTCERDSTIKVVILQGAGEKGFCAGGDMKTLYEAGKKGEAVEQGEQFFTLEYEVDEMVYQFNKPIIACLDGIVMGGGVGLAYGASNRIVTERTKWAMPEMNIGFFPDVGAAYFLNKAPGHIGRYLALTSTMIKAKDVMYISAADHFMKSEQLEKFLDALKAQSFTEKTIEDTLTQLIQQYTSDSPDEDMLKDIQPLIDEHFRYDTVEDIVDSLEKDDSDASQKMKDTLLTKSPVSLKVTLKQLVDGQGLSFADCLARDLTIAGHFMEHPDFLEGVRSVLIDKDHAPNYRFKTLKDVSENQTQEFFA